MKKVTYFILILFITPSISLAQKYQQGKIKLTNGEVISGLVKPPNDPGEKNIEYKENADADKVKYGSDEVEEVMVYVESYEHRFIRKVVRMPKKKEPKKEKDYRYTDPIWLVVMVEGHTTLYAAGPLVKIKKDGQLRIKLNWNGSGVPPDIMFYLENENLEMPTWTALYSVATMGQMKTFKFWTTKYFADYPDLVSRIEAEEFEVSEIADVVSEYNAWKAKN